MITRIEFENYCGVKKQEVRSDQNLIITCDGDYADVAYDSANSPRDWQETDMPIGTPIPDENQEYAAAGKILMGVTE